MNFIYIKFKSFVPNSKKIYCVSIVKKDWLIVFTEIIALYSENHTEPIIHCVGKIQSFIMLKQVVHTVNAKF
jgi:hypothetical protein